MSVGARAGRVARRRVPPPLTMHRRLKPKWLSLRAGRRERAGVSWMNGKIDSIHHHLLEVICEAATAPESRQSASTYHPLRGGGGGGGGGV